MSEKEKSPRFRGGMAFATPVEKAKDFKGTIKRLSTYLMPFRFRLVAVLVMAILSTVFAIYSPKVLGKATTEIFNGITGNLKGIEGSGIRYDELGRILAVLLILYVVSATFSYFTQLIMAGVSQKTVYNLRKEVSEKLSKLPLQYYDKYTHGEILSRVTNDLDNVSNTLSQTITQLITSAITLVGVVVMMFSINVVMALITFVTLPASILSVKKIVKKSQEYFKGQQKILGELNGHIEEMYGGHNIVKVYNYERKSAEKFAELNDKLYSYGWKAQFVSGVVMPIMNFISNVGYVFVSVVGGILVTSQAITVGDIQAFIQYSRQFGQPIVQTANVMNILQSTVASSERVFQVLDEEEEVDVKQQCVPKDLLGSIDFQKVSFSYNKEQELIKDLNLSVKQGETIAIVGPTGAGKTTIVNLLMRFYDIDSGNIYLDGNSIYDYGRGDYRSKFGMVLQDTWLFAGTIRDNIAYGKENATEEDVINAAKAANVDFFIRTLPKGYDTEIDEEASNISQGQKQLITIARAFLSDPSILILDEATSSVDTRTELLIQKAMKTLMKGRTSFIIAHRLSTIAQADNIIVVNDGKIIEQGNHKELLERQGFYAELYNSQFVSTKVG